jgi:hypothetical protein
MHGVIGSDYSPQVGVSCPFVRVLCLLFAFGSRGESRHMCDLAHVLVAPGLLAQPVCPAYAGAGPVLGASGCPPSS